MDGGAGELAPSLGLPAIIFCDRAHTAGRERLALVADAIEGDSGHSANAGNGLILAAMLTRDFK
jgi:hypothetical protein